MESIETFTEQIAGRKVEIRHDYTGYKPLSEQSEGEGLPLVVEMISEDIADGKCQGVFPYNNCENAVYWAVKSA